MATERRTGPWALAGLLAALLLFGQPAVLFAEPFTLDEVLAALRSGKPPQQELVRQISARHAAFVLSPEAQAKLVAAGASEQLLQAIKFNPELPRTYTPGSTGETADAGTGTQPRTTASAAVSAAATATPSPATPVAKPASAQQTAQQPSPADSDDDLIITDEAIFDVPTGPITPHEVNDLLVAGGDQAVLIGTISLRGVSFKYTPDLGRAWRELGATPDLLAVLATAKVTLPPLPEDFILVPVERAANFDASARKGFLDLRLHVDDVVEVRLQGERVIWKTLRGSDGHDEGSVWNQPFPMGPVRSLEVVKRRGRGQHIVMQQPTMENDFEMMLRIYDPQRAAASYHLRFEWEH